MTITAQMIARDIVFNAFEAKLCGSGNGIPRSFVANHLKQMRREGISNVVLFDVIYMYLHGEIESKNEKSS